MDVDDDAALQPQIKQNGTGPRKDGPAAAKGEKSSRQPAKNRREAIKRQIDGVLDHLKALDDAVPTACKDRLDARIGGVEQAMVPYVEDGTVAT